MIRKDNSDIQTALKVSSICLYNQIFKKKRYGNYKYFVKKIPQYEWNVQTVGRINKLKIEVRSSEKPHNLPHFHVTAPGKVDAVYTIEPLAYYEGQVDGKSNKAILQWAEINRDILVEMWNDFHGYRIKVG